MVDVILRGRENKKPSLVVGAALAAVLLFGFGVAVVPMASADIVSGQSTNVQEGDNDNETNQDGRSTSGDAVAGQVVGVVSSGDTSLDATNLSSDVDAESGDAEGANSARSFTGTNHADGVCPPNGADRAHAQACPSGADAADIDNLIAVLVQLGNNSSSTDQSADVRTGDAIAGQVAGAVVSGLADIVLANTSEDVDATSGDGEVTNLAEATVGSSSVTFGRRCIGGCPLPQGLGTLFEDASSVTGEVGPLVRFRGAPVPDVAPLGTSGIAIAGLLVLAAMWVGRRRRVYASPLASPGGHADASGYDAADSPARAGESKRPQVTSAEVVTAALVVLGSFLVARRLSRR